MSSEKELLHLHLQVARDVLVYKTEGLSEADRRRPMTQTGTNLIGLVKHMAWIESWYLCEFFGRERPRFEWEWEFDAGMGHHSDMYAKPEETTDELLAGYRAATAAADVTITELGLDDMGKHWSGAEVSLRSMVHTVLLDTTRHAGHADIVRELIDGGTGDRNSPSGFPGNTDEEYRSQYLARVRGEIDTPAWFDYLRIRGKEWS
ncbi:MAG: DinB family protein [Acidimicrobiales bacterium]|nr:DinB family protein [Acidimicrobiales bacterium]